MAHRRVGERSLTHLPALADIARDAHPLVVVMKSAQVGLTELEVTAMTWSRHSRLSVPMTRSAMALAFGACTGVRIVSIPSRRARAMKSPP